MRFLFFSLPLHLIRISFYLLVFLLPVLGVWLASSLVAYLNGPTLLALFSGILLFPLVPILWDLRSQRRGKAGILTWGDRITLRTLALNLAFIAILLVLRPQTSFLALSTRGDWFLDSSNLQGPQVELIRQGLFKLASGLEGLYLAFHDNPFEQYADGTQVGPQPSRETPAQDSSQDSTTHPTDTPAPTADDSSGTQTEIPRPAPQPRPVPQASHGTNARVGEWPWTGAGIHPAVANLPKSAETSIESVAQYILSREKDPVLRLKALHDYVADRIAYDAASYFSGQYPPQDAETVFRTRKAVCAGYAKLLEALGKASGLEIVYVVGDSRSSTSDLSGQGHAWNAARIGDHWYLIDATWDSGYVDRATGFTKKYRTDYLLPPPDVMGITHFPDDAAWQLRSPSILRGEFLRQPMMRPQFFAEGMTLVAPTRSQTDTRNIATLQVQNPNQRWLLASYGAKNSQQTENCMGNASQGPQISCPLPGPGTYEVRLFSSNQQYGDFSYVGQLEFNRR